MNIMVSGNVGPNASGVGIPSRACTEERREDGPVGRAAEAAVLARRTAGTDAMFCLFLRGRRRRNNDNGGGNCG